MLILYVLRNADMTRRGWPKCKDFSQVFLPSRASLGGKEQSCENDATEELLAIHVSDSGEAATVSASARFRKEWSSRVARCQRMLEKHQTLRVDWACITISSKTWLSQSLPESCNRLLLVLSAYTGWAFAGR